MCESALINMYDYLNPGNLTNIVNGHASNAEKNAAQCTTKAREVESFLRDVALDSKSFYQTFLESGIDLGKDEICFFKIATALCDKDSNNDDDVYESTRAAWKISKDPKYAVGIVGTLVKGAYVVDKWSTTSEGKRKQFDKKDVGQLMPEERKVLDLLLSMKDCLLTDEYLNGQWVPYYSKKNAKKWLEHKFGELARKIIGVLKEGKKLSPEELASIGDLEPYRTKWQEISSITGFTPELSKNGKKKTWKYNGKSFDLGKTLTEKDFQERLFVDWFVDEMVKKEIN